jgi:hypothetical protein
MGERLGVHAISITTNIGQQLSAPTSRDHT